MSKSHGLFRSNITITWLFLSSHAQPSFYFCRHHNIALPSHYKWNLLSPQLPTGSSKDCVITPNLAKEQIVLLSPLPSIDSVLLHAQKCNIFLTLLLANFSALCPERVPCYLFEQQCLCHCAIISVWSHLLPLPIACNIFLPGTAFLCWFAQPLSLWDPGHRNLLQSTLSILLPLFFMHHFY